MSHISANNIDRKLICVSLSLLSGSQIQNMANILVCGVSGSHFKNGRHEFSMSHISANNIDMKLIIVSMSKFSESRNPNVAIVLVCKGCGSHLKNGRHEFSMSHISANKEVNLCVFVVDVRASESKYGNYFGLWGLWQPFSKWPMRNCQCPISWRIMETET